MLFRSIDQGLASCGYSVVEISKNSKGQIIHKDLIAYGFIKTTSKEEMGLRLCRIYSELEYIARLHKPELICLEKLFFSTPGKGSRKKSASIVPTNMVTGLIYFLSGVTRIPIKDFTPGTVKKLITGNGRAEKIEMETAIKKIFGDLEIYNNEHIADSSCIAYTGAMIIIEELEDDLIEEEELKECKTEDKEDISLKEDKKNKKGVKK